MHKDSRKFQVKSSRRLPAACALLVAAIVVSACGTALKSAGMRPPAAPSKDAAPDHPLDTSSLPELTPRVEPLSKYGNPPSYAVGGQTYTIMESSAGYVERGIASWYGTKFHGQYTSSREPYDMYGFSAAHKTLPIPCYVLVTNLRNGRTLIVRVNDRGPFVDNRLIDLSYAAADRLGILGTGTGLVEVRAIDPRAPAAPVQTVADSGAAPVETAQPQVQSAPSLYLQVGAFQSHDNAERLREKLLRKASVAVQIVKATLNDGVLYRVRLGPMENVEQADSLSTLIHQLGLGEPHVVIN